MKVAKRKFSVLDIIGEPIPRIAGDAVDVDAEPAVLTEALGSGNMLRVSKGEVRVHQRIYSSLSSKQVTYIFDILCCTKT